MTTAHFEVLMLLTIHHVFYGFWIIFAEIYQTGLRLSEGVAACAVEEAGSRADDCSVHRP